VTLIGLVPGPIKLTRPGPVGGPALFVRGGMSNGVIL
jgi:hypothetical protein